MGRRQELVCPDIRRTPARGFEIVLHHFADGLAPVFDRRVSQDLEPFRPKLARAQPPGFQQARILDDISPPSARASRTLRPIIV